VIGQILNRGTVVSQLPVLAADLERVAEGAVERPPHGADLTDEELRDTARLLEHAAAHPPEDEDADQAGTRRAETSPIEDSAYIPRDAVTSIVQSSLEQFLREQHEERVQRVAAKAEGRRGDELPPVTDEYLDGEPLEDRVEGGQNRRFGGRFEIPSDPGWVSCLVAQGIRRLKGKQAFLDQPVRREMGETKVRLVIVGDWGSGIPRARRVAGEIRKVLQQGLDAGLEQHVIHLGDVYYSGFDYEYRDRFLANWPVLPEEAGAITSWNLVGNHDMYAGGHGYFKIGLADDRFAAHEGCSYFELANQNWSVLGLDTGWEEGGLAGKQAQWLEDRLADADGKRRTLILSHHQLFSVFGKPAAGLRAKALPILERHPVDAWFWGHEHRCMTFEQNEGVGYGVCLGHGGVPVYQWNDETAPLNAPGRWEYRGRIEKTLGLEPWAIFGFAVVDLEEGAATVSYRNEFGTEDRSDTF
jgi:Calcineurin-like phosphoesterase